MTQSLDEFRRARTAPREVAPEVRAIAQEVVRASALTGDENWDWWNRHIEAALKAAKRHLAYETSVLQNPFAPEDALRLAHIKVGIIASRIETLTEVLMLPKFLRDNSEKARKQIAEMERDAA